MFASLTSTAAGLWVALAAPVFGMFAVLRGYEARLGGPVCETALLPRRQEMLVAATVSAAGLELVVLSANSLSEAIAAVGLFAPLTYLAVFDSRFLAVPVRTCLALACAGALYWAATSGWTHALDAATSGGAAWCGFRLLDRLYIRVRGHSGLGAGDALVAADIAVWTSPVDLAWAVAAGCGLTLAFAAVRGRGRRDALSEAWPLAPGLAAGAAIVFVAHRVLG